MPRQPLFTEVMDVLQRRIAAGAYMLKDIPGERKLAEEVGVSYMTARKAVARLIEKEVLSRRPNGGLMVHPRVQSERGHTQVTLLTPAFPSAHLVRCRLDISEAMRARGIEFRSVEYMHWDDTVVAEALDGSDGLIIIPLTEPVPPLTLKTFRDPANRIVIFDGDMTEEDLPSIRLFSRDHIAQIYDHLFKLGHRRVDCLNTQGHNAEIDRRLRHWRDWTAERACEGELHDDPVPAFGDTMSRAHQLMLRVLDTAEERPTAVVCTTQPAALGAVRAATDRSLRVGVDISEAMRARGIEFRSVEYM
ncbi:MAG: substrate-binding domain-containing protein, partial [Planctomycetota bacterium]